jgi:hypothetical protein
MNEKQPSSLKIILNDYAAFLSLMFCMIAPGLYLYDALIAENPSQGFRWIAIGMFLLAFLFLATRFISIISLYNSGIETTAVINEIGFFRDRGYIKYIYSLDNKKYASRITVMKNKSTEKYQIGNEVEVMVSRENPKKSLIKELFI